MSRPPNRRYLMEDPDERELAVWLAGTLGVGHSMPLRWWVRGGSNLDLPVIPERFRAAWLKAVSDYEDHPKP